MSHVEDKRQAILDATLKLIAEKGFHGTAMGKVAKEAGVSTGIIYHYFKSKDELIFELYRSLKQDMGRAILDDFDEGRPLSVQVRQICDSSFRYNLKHPRVAIFMQQYVTSPFYRALDESEMMRFFGPINNCMVRAQEEMILKDLPQEVMGALLLSVASSLALQQESGRLNLTEELIQKTLDALWEAIRR